MITMAWIILLVLVLSLEVFTLLARRGTLTEHVRWLRARFWGELLIVPIWAWLTYHWFFDLGRAWVDLTVVIVAAILVLFFELVRDNSVLDP